MALCSFGTKQDGIETLCEFYYVLPPNVGSRRSILKKSIPYAFHGHLAPYTVLIWGVEV